MHGRAVQLVVAQVVSRNAGLFWNCDSSQMAAPVRAGVVPVTQSKHLPKVQRISQHGTLFASMPGCAREFRRSDRGNASDCLLILMGISIYITRGALISCQATALIRQPVWWADCTGSPCMSLDPLTVFCHNYIHQSLPCSGACIDLCHLGHDYESPTLVFIIMTRSPLRPPAKRAGAHGRPFMGDRLPCIPGGRRGPS